VTRWFWRSHRLDPIKRAWLFSRIVWRPVSEESRLDVRTAWDVAGIVWNGLPREKGWGE
jgi:hypothetical protein